MGFKVFRFSYLVIFNIPDDWCQKYNQSEYNWKIFRESTESSADWLKWAWDIDLFPQIRDIGGWIMKEFVIRYANIIMVYAHSFEIIQSWFVLSKLLHFSIIEWF